MKHRLLLLTIILGLSLNACNKQSEPGPETVQQETSAVEETTPTELTEPIEETTSTENSLDDDKAMNPDYNNPEEYAADTEETIAESSDGSGLSFNVDILDETAEGYKKDLEAGRITQETYDVLMGFLEEAEALADENGDFSLDEVYESVDAKNESTTSTSSSSGSYESTPEADAWLAEHGTKGVEGGEGTPGSLDGYHDPDFAGYRMN